MAENTIENAVGASQEFRIGNTVLDIYPIMIKDWPEASKLMFVLNFESLADIAYVGSLELLKDLIMLAGRSKDMKSVECFSVLENMVNFDYICIKQILVRQNDIDMDRLMDRISKVSGKPKNA